MQTCILVIHGPNLNCLGLREPDHYGGLTLIQIDNIIRADAYRRNISLDIRQTNIEGDIIAWIHSASETYNGIIINPAGFSYSSIGIRDAISLSKLPTIEVHLSNIHARESFRRNSLIAPVCIGQISGFKESSYILALQAIILHLERPGKC